MALDEEDRAGGIDARGDERRCHLARVATHLLGVLHRGQRMLVDDAIDALEAVLQPHPIADGTQIIAELNAMGRLDAGKDAAVH